MILPYVKKIFFVFLLVCVPQISSAAFTINTITYNSEEAIDIVIVGDGFTAAQQGSFDTLAAAVPGYLFAADNPPFNTNQDKFNFYTVPTISNESGISYLGGAQKDTALRTFRNRSGLPRYTGLPEDARAELRNELKKTFKKQIYVIMIINANVYGGSGDLDAQDRFISMMQTMNYPTYLKYLVKHEFGHSFGDLADEYSSTCTPAVIPEHLTFEIMDKDNVTYDNVNDRKWDDIVVNPQYFLGANYCTNEWYRSSSTGLMRALGNTLQHNELGKILVQNRIDEDIAYNQKVESYQVDGPMTLPSETDRNIRIHADNSVLTSNLTCDNLYIAEDSNLDVEYGVTINCNSITALGTITYASAPATTRSRRGGYRRYGCKDSRAINFTRFATHNQSMCVYDVHIGNPPPMIEEIKD